MGCFGSCGPLGMHVDPQKFRLAMGVFGHLRSAGGGSTRRVRVESGSKQLLTRNDTSRPLSVSLRLVSGSPTDTASVSGQSDGVPGMSALTFAVGSAGPAVPVSLRPGQAIYASATGGGAPVLDFLVTEVVM